MTLLLVLLAGCYALTFAGSPGASAKEMQAVTRSDGICKELVAPHGFHCEEFMIQTQDGYLLGLQRVYRKIQKSGRTVILYHGIDNGGDIWLLNPPRQSLALMLANRGHEVWIPNTRTSTYSYGHVSLSKDDKMYWDWSLDELVNYDLPAVVEQVTAKSETQKVDFVAYSQSSQALLGAFSEGKLVDQISKAVMIAPVAYVSHTTSPIALIATRFNLGLVLVGLNIYEFNPRSTSGAKILETLCVTVNICESDILSLITGPNCCVDDTRMGFINKYELQSTSVKNWNHLGQLFQKKSFTKFDYGEKENQERYGTKGVPEYLPSRIPTDIPMMLIHGGKDALADPDDVHRLLGELKQTPEKVLFLPHYAHFDFVLGTSASKDVYEGIVNFLES
ncbi:triacylglycerol lipase 1 [Selaginella moellendorffii]|nr:triacylglycerol lipase 1 [Selaginella moellendorffii]|eukprot:XP_002978910.2 triacylglycerol lipase 1 [Selaginella moellendorffii]